MIDDEKLRKGLENDAKNQPLWDDEWKAIVAAATAYAARATPPALTEEQEREVKAILGEHDFIVLHTIGYTISFTGKPGCGLAEELTHVKDSECQFCHGSGFVTEEIFHKVWTPDNVSQGGGTVAETVAVPCRNCDSPWLTTTSLPGGD